MSDTLMGSNEAEQRIRRMMGQTNSGRIEYPKGSNDRGSGGREHHAEGDVVGKSDDDAPEAHSHGDRVGQKKNSRLGGEGSAPGRGGSHMGSHFGEPEHGRQMGAPRHMAVKQAHAENHRAGELVGREGAERERRAMGGGAGQPQMVAKPPMKRIAPMEVQQSQPQPQALRHGGKPHPHHRRYNHEG